MATLKAVLCGLGFIVGGGLVLFFVEDVLDVPREVVCGIIGFGVGYYLSYLINCEPKKE